VLIIVEGPDCVGKSTFAEKLRKLIEWRYTSDTVELVHRGPPTSHPLDEYEVPLLAYRQCAGRHVVCDRWHLGELVYPEVLGRSTELTAPVLSHIELFLASRAALVVLITAPTEHLRECVRTRGDDLVDDDQVDAIRAGFLDVSNRTTLPLVHLTSDDVDGSDAVEYVLGEADALAQTTRVLTRYVTYVGSRWPKLLLLGDVRRTGTAEGDLRPAFMPYPATSGHYLLDALINAPGFGVGVANACDVDSVDTLLQDLGNPDTVTLGRNALRSTPWVTRHVPHPQYVRRFHHHRHAAYRDAILGVRPWSST